MIKRTHYKIIFILYICMISLCAFAEDQGIWVRWRINTAQHKHWARVISETNPYGGYTQLTGSVGSQGLFAGQSFLPTRNSESSYISGGQWSAWIQLPPRGSFTWHTVLVFYFWQDNKPQDYTPLELEFSQNPANAAATFKTASEGLEPFFAAHEKSMSVAFLMPEDPSKLYQLQTFNEWANNRTEMVKNLGLGAPPNLSKIIIRADAQTGNRQGLGISPERRVEQELSMMNAVGINAPFLNYELDSRYKSLFPKHSMTATSLAIWALTFKYYFQPGDDKEPASGESLTSFYERALDRYYLRIRDSYQQTYPEVLKVSNLVNLGDEIEHAITVEDINATSYIKNDWIRYLQSLNLTPSFFGKSSWEELIATNDRSLVAGKNGAPCPSCSEFEARRYYYTWRYLNYITGHFYRAATTSVKKYFPNSKLIVSNYQSGPFQVGFMGNNNNWNPIDYWFISQLGAFNGIQSEDWVPENNLGSDRVAFGAEIMRSVVEPRNQPMTSYVVGGSVRRLWSFLMHGVKDHNLFIWGPVQTTGPAIADWGLGLQLLHRGTTFIKKAESILEEAKVRARKVAILIDPSSDAMMVKGECYGPERQNIYKALKDSYIQADLVGAEDVVKNNTLNNYDVLYVTDFNVSRAAQQAILAWVQRGGNLYITVGAAQWDEFNQPSNILNPAIGVSNRDMQTWAPDWCQFNRPHFWTMTRKYYYEIVGTINMDHPVLGGSSSMTAWGARMNTTLLPATEVIGKYNDGKPAVLLNRFGNGRVLTVGALVGEAYTRAQYADEHVDVVGGNETFKPSWHRGLGNNERLVAATFPQTLGITPQVQLSVPAVLSNISDGKDGSVVVLNNGIKERPLDSVDLDIMTKGRTVEQVISSAVGNLSFVPITGGVRVTLPLKDIDIVELRYAPISAVMTPTPQVKATLVPNIRLDVNVNKNKVKMAVSASACTSIVVNAAHGRNSTAELIATNGVKIFSNTDTIRPITNITIKNVLGLNQRSKSRNIYLVATCNGAVHSNVSILNARKIVSKKRGSIAKIINSMVDNKMGSQ